MTHLPKKPPTLHFTRWKPIRIIVAWTTSILLFSNNDYLYFLSVSSFQWSQRQELRRNDGPTIRSIEGKPFGIRLGRLRRADMAKFRADSSSGIEAFELFAQAFEKMHISTDFSRFEGWRVIGLRLRWPALRVRIQIKARDYQYQNIFRSKIIKEQNEHRRKAFLQVTLYSISPRFSVLGQLRTKLRDFFKKILLFYLNRWTITFKTAPKSKKCRKSDQLPFSGVLFSPGMFSIDQRFYSNPKHPYSPFEARCITNLHLFSHIFQPTQKCGCGRSRAPFEPISKSIYFSVEVPNYSEAYYNNQLSQSVMQIRKSFLSKARKYTASISDNLTSLYYCHSPQHVQLQRQNHANVMIMEKPSSSLLYYPSDEQNQEMNMLSLHLTSLSPFGISLADLEDSSPFLFQREVKQIYETSTFES